jgi:acetyl esterase/lipase
MPLLAGLSLAVSGWLVRDIPFSPVSAATAGFAAASRVPQAKFQGRLQVQGLSLDRYAYAANPQTVFYLTRPMRPNGKGVLLVHGGNFLYGSALDADMMSLARLFLQQGYTVASLDYRTLTDQHWPIPVTDVAQGVSAALKIMGPTVRQAVYVGYSAGAVAGALLAYSDDYPPLPATVTQFVGISGLYSKAAVGELPIQAIEDASRDAISLMDIVQDIGRPKSRVAALLLEGSADYFADKYPGRPNSHAATLERLLKRHRIAAQTHWVDRKGYSGHEGPLLLLARRDDELLSLLRRFLTS